MKEQIARIIARECFGAESIWKSKMRVVDLILDALLGDPGHDVTAAVCKPMDDRTQALATFHAIIQAIKDGK